MAQSTAGGIMGFIQTYGLLIVMVVGLFLLMILPQKKREKQAKEMMSSLKPGDNIRTIGGFYGRISQVKEDVIIVEMAPDSTKLTLSKGAIASVDNSDIENTSTPEIESK